MSDETKRLLWPFQTEEEIQLHWKLFNESRKS